jgi:hypothetical protein
VVRSNTIQLHVEFGDCDPAGIVFYPNYFRWMDVGTRRFFAACGVPGWNAQPVPGGIIGTPLVDASGATHEIIQPVEPACTRHSRRPACDGPAC